MNTQNDATENDIPEDDVTQEDVPHDGALNSCYDSRAEFNYTFHIALDPPLIYVNNPKCGCTTAKASLNRWFAAWHGRSLEYASMAEIHNRGFNPLMAPRELGSAAETIIRDDPTFFRVTVFREPLARLASAYASKLSWNSTERQSFNRAAGRPPGTDLPLAHFVALIHGNANLRDLNEHWRSQSRHTAAALLRYDFVCLQETLDADLLALRGRVFPGIDIEVFQTREHFPGNRSASAQVRDSMTPAQIAMIEETYADDFALYAKALHSRSFASEAS